uniref:Uncharacterized protein n=1 Tax=Gopherus agassizii TaxID=38772 RepID=A0A452HLK5_9SAUR
MACKIYWLILMGLFCVSCEEYEPVDTMCTEVTNKSYSCEDLGLREIPERLPTTTEILDFSFNLLSSLHNSTFSKLKNLVYLDLTRALCKGRLVTPPLDGCMNRGREVK